MEKHTAYYEMLEQLKHADCPICTLASKRTHGFLERYLDEGVVHEHTWDRLVAAGGWCGRHAGEIVGFDDGLAVSLFYGFLFKRKSAQLNTGSALQALEPGQAQAPGLLQRLGGDAGQLACPACDIERETERTQAHLIAKALDETEAMAALEAHPGLCLGHVDLVMERAAPAQRAAFQTQQAKKLQALADELELFVRRSEHPSAGSGQAFGPERDAWKRALKRYYGSRLGGDRHG